MAAARSRADLVTDRRQPYAAHHLHQVAAGLGNGGDLPANTARAAASASIGSDLPRCRRAERSGRLTSRCGTVLIAIFKYRLYDIDRLINRTLVYGLLTALLGGVYAGTVLVLGSLFGGVAGNPPSWAVAGATLAVAALFQPARRRVQQEVDRRFNRRRYDMAKTVEAFSTRLRDEVDLDTLSTELLAVVDQTVQPTRVSLWLRPPAQDTARSAS